MRDFSLTIRVPRTAVLLGLLGMGFVCFYSGKRFNEEVKLRRTAAISGKYSGLLMTLRVPEDEGSYGEFYDYGYSDEKAYKDHEGLPDGYWVYVAPNWYLWEKARHGKRN